eukprot:194349_1
MKSYHDGVGIQRRKKYEKNKDNTDSDVDCWMIILRCYFVGMFIWLIISITSLSNAHKSEGEIGITKENCFLISYEEQLCNIYNDTQYKYTAYSYEKCENQTIESEYIDDPDHCPESLKIMNQEYICYVSECNNKPFTFIDGDFNTEKDKVISYTIQIVISLLLLLCPCVCWWCDTNFRLIRRFRNRLNL